MARGLVIYHGSGMVNGRRGDNFLIAPPLIVEEPQIKEIVTILKEALSKTSGKLL